MNYQHFGSSAMRQEVATRPNALPRIRVTVFLLSYAYLQNRRQEEQRWQTKKSALD
ncbi:MULTISPECIES: hypothetical protein [unclassified Enterococcus]|uniref:hypothetical protein n=1 Tax=unclassified Enterococcus TaxID=2608891 RepID=UPI001555C935|nr:MULTISPECIES: hypothetical protein [unclassified Enterococcus]MBS7577046.1 hypothetical protein [Enterococcus sp. MMGLQ5-2]MBS7584507.1 hypothetical protein [Enterococcus sp. MMGLQ5-1]NPD12362.1 hypothetical protein [Enterococcus sp. MMGLQ5-1]NPD36880.1 hypothetical protein [Enterococcus sp. MMGLQ5-2]